MLLIFLRSPQSNIRVNAVAGFVAILKRVVITVPGTREGFDFLNAGFQSETLATFPRYIEDYAEQVRGAV
jgi:hypothetical protein